MTNQLKMSEKQGMK